MKNLFYKPKVLGQGILFHIIDGRFRIFYLHDWRIKKITVRDSLVSVSTDNFVDYKEHGEMISRGKINKQDLYLLDLLLRQMDCIIFLYRTQSLFSATRKANAGSYACH